MARLRIVAVLGCALVAVAAVARADVSAPVAAVPRPGVIYGTLLWKQAHAPSFPSHLCEGIHSDRFDGLADVVVVAEPLDDATDRALRDAAGSDDDADELVWDEDRAVRVARTTPWGTVSVENVGDAPLALEVYRAAQVVRRITIAAHATLALGNLPAGVLRVRRTGSAVDGWIYVTPWPSKVTGGNCRYSFDVPYGRYRLRGWHPHAGMRSMVVTVRATKSPPRSDLAF